MHWFWRAAFAVGVGVTVGYASVLRILAGVGRDGTLMPLAFLSSYAVAVLVYGLLTRRYYRAKGQDDETRCRKCDYILRGLTEPRCPECGERI